MGTRTAARPTAGTLRSLELARVRPNPGQPRKLFDEEKMAELRASITANGLLQPITVRPDGDGWVIVAGERRWRACTDLGHERIAAKIVEMSDAPAFMASMTENVTRADMTVMEEAAGYAELVALGYTVAEIAVNLGKRPQDITGRIDLLALVPSAQDAVAKGLLRPNLAWYMTKLNSDGQQIVLRRWARGDFKTDDDAIALVRILQQTQDQEVMFGEAPTLEVEKARQKLRRQAMNVLEKARAVLVDVAALGEIDPVQLADALGGQMGPLRALAEQMKLTAASFDRSVRTAEAFIAARQELGGEEAPTSENT